MKIGTTTFHRYPRVALSISDIETNKDIQRYRPDILEIRADLFKSLDSDYVKAQILNRKKIGIPLLLTVRSDKREGAFRVIADNKKRSVIENALRHVQAVDIELRSRIAAEIIRCARRQKKKVIVSYHDFQKTPRLPTLTGLLRRSKKQGADIVKIATMARSCDDWIRLMTFTHQNRKASLITMALGAKGSLSRLVFPAAGSLLTYCYLGRPAGPGQLPVQTLQEHLRIYFPQ